MVSEETGPEDKNKDYHPYYNRLLQLAKERASTALLTRFKIFSISSSWKKNFLPEKKIFCRESV